MARTRPETYGVGNFPLPVGRPSDAERRAGPARLMPRGRLTVDEVAALTGYPAPTILGWVESAQLRACDAMADPEPWFDPADVAALLIAGAPSLGWLDRADRGAEAPDGVLEAAGLRLDPAVWEASYQGRRIRPTPTEYKLLLELVSQAGRVVPSAELLRRVWGFQGDSDGYIAFANNHLLRIHLTRLRRRLDAVGAPPSLIRTVVRVGLIVDLVPWP